MYVSQLYIVLTNFTLCLGLYTPSPRPAQIFNKPQDTAGDVISIAVVVTHKPGHGLLQTLVLGLRFIALLSTLNTDRRSPS
jgi:hypothetical protein